MIKPAAAAVSEDGSYVLGDHAESNWLLPRTFSFHSFIIYQKWAELLHCWQALGQNAKTCRHNVNHIIIFLPSLPDRRNSWRAWIVLRIPFQPLSHTGPCSLSGSDGSRNTESYSQLHTTQTDTEENTQVNFPWKLWQPFRHLFLHEMFLEQVAHFLHMLLCTPLCTSLVISVTCLQKTLQLWETVASLWAGSRQITSDRKWRQQSFKTTHISNTSRTDYKTQSWYWAMILTLLT